MARANASSDISILPPGYTDDVGLTLLQNEDGSVAFSKSTQSILPTAAPPGAPSSESLNPEVRVEYVMRSFHRGIGSDRHQEGSARAGLVKNVDTRFEDQAMCGPKIRYISDIGYISNGIMEAWSSGLPVGWTKILGTETIAQETTIVDSGISSAKVTSSTSGTGLRFTLTPAEFLQCRVTLTARAYVPAGNGNATVRIANSIGNQEDLSVGTDAWETLSATLDVSTTALTALSIDLIPSTGLIAYFDNIVFKIEYLVGPPGPFVELEISGTDTLFHFSGRTTWKLDTADTDDNGLPRWIATELASHNITDVRLMNDRMWRAEGASGLWTHSTDGVTWTDNTLSGDDRYADQLAVTQTIFGYDALWKATKPNQLAVSTTPSTGGWAYYSLGNSDTDIIDILVEDNLLYVVKEDGVFMIGSNGIPQNVTTSWSNMRQTARSAGGGGWFGNVYIPAGRHGLWEIGPNVRRSAHPGDEAPAYDEYNGPVTKAIGDDSWLYEYLQKRDDSTPDTTNILAGRPTGGRGAWRWGQVAEIDAGMVKHGWITGTQFPGTKMFWSSQDTESTVAQSNSKKSSGTQTNIDNSGKREWSTVSNISASNDTYATWPDESDLGTGGDSPGTGANTDVADQIAWSNPGNIASSDDSYATNALASVTTSDTAPTANSGATGYANPGNAYASDDSRMVYASLAGFGTNSSTIDFDTFGLSLPSDAVITDVQIKHEGNMGTAVSGRIVWGMIKGGVRQSQQYVDTLATSDSEVSQDQSVGTWFNNGSLSVAEAEASDFGIWMHYNNNTQGTPASSDFATDFIRLNVTYHVPKTDGLRATNYGITLPSDATVLGIQVDVERKVSAGTDVSDDLVQLVVGGSLSGDDKASATAWSTTEAEVTYGGTADLWGLTPTRAQIIASDFGVEIRATKGTSTTDRTLSVDHIKITITYISNETSDYLDAQNFGFAIPTGATIDGIIVDIERKSSDGSAKDATLQLLNASGSPTGDDKALTLNAWGTSDSVQSYGGTSDNWSLSPTVAMVNDADFGVRLSVSADIDSTTSVDHISVKIYYTSGAGSELNNKLGWISVPDTENPRYDPAYEFESGGELHTGRINRFPGWKTNWQEVTVKTSTRTGEALGSNGREIRVLYDSFDGSGDVELGGTGNGTFSTSPSQTKYFKSASVASVISEDIDVHLEFNHTNDDETPIVTELSISGTVRPKIVDVFQFSVLVGDDIGNETTRGADKITALRKMLDPNAWSSTLYDREGTAHVVIPYVNGYSEVDAVHYADADGKPRIVRVITMQCFVVPNSGSWSS